MKRTKRTCLTRILVLVLVVAMLTPTTLAAGSGFGLSSWFQGVWDRFVGWFQPVQPEVPEELPNTGPFEIGLAIVILVALAAAIAYWVHTRKAVKHVTKRAKGKK